MKNKLCGVLGAGTMGNGIAHVFARAGWAVILCDREQRFVDRGMAAIAKNLGREVAAHKLSQADADAALKRIHPTLHFADLHECSIVVEAATEEFSVKADLFRQLDALVDHDAILASNTSSISITRLAGQIRHAHRVIGMHFFNPVPMMQLVEIVRGIGTWDAVNAAVHDIARELGKTPVEVNDSPGFVSNRILLPMINEAIFVVAEGIAKPEAVDEVFKLGMAHPMGPLQLADFIGLDTCLNILRVLQQELGDAKFHPCPLLVRMVDAGWLGRKSGKGFYEYPAK